MSSSSSFAAATVARAFCPVVVIGAGNLLLSDEGIGVHVVRALQTGIGEIEGVELLEVGSGGLALVHALAGRSKAVIVDCARMGEPAGTLRRFLPEEVRSVKAGGGLSLHEGDVLQLLRLTTALGTAPGEVVIIGIEPADLSPGLALSPVLQGQLATYVAAVLRELPADASAA